jgi:hypothetical protein
MSAKTVHDNLLLVFSQDAACATEFGTNIKKGYGKGIKISSVGKMLNVAYVGEMDIEKKLAQAAYGSQKVRVAYSFYISVSFAEPDQEKAEERKASYSAMLKNAIDKNLDINPNHVAGQDCIAITKIGNITIAEIPYSNGIYFGEMLLLCYKDEVRGSR